MIEQNPNQRLPRFCNYEGSDYRTAFWEGQGREYEDLAERIALRRLLPASGQRIIDIGGGFGRLVDLYGGYNEIVLMDYSRSQLEDGRRRLGERNITYVAANVYQMPFAEGAFDMAVMVRVLHHLSDMPTALQQIRGILRPGAALVMEYANKRNLKAILRYWMGRQAHSPFSHEPWEFVELNFDFHPAYVEGSLAGAGLRIERQLSVSHFRIDLLKRRVPANLLATVDGWLQRPTARLGLTPSIFLRCRVQSPQAPQLASALFRCPRCGRGELTRGPDALDCSGCGSRWSTAGGIHDFREPIA